MAQIIQKAKETLGVGASHGKSYTLATGDKVGSTGYGLMGLTWRAQPQEKSKSIETMHEALKLGANFWNGGEFYGKPEFNSLHLLNEYFQKYPEDEKKVILSIKGGSVIGQFGVDGSKKNIRRSIDECLRVLDGKKKLDLFEPARVDPKVPFEVTIKAVQDYVDAGKLGGISLSEVSATSIRRAAKIGKISAVEIEYSLFETTAATNGVFETCAELSIPIVAYSPLGRGFLTGDVRKRSDLADDDARKNFPRFSEENFDKNMELVHEVEKLAKRKGVKPGQVALSWVKAQSERNGNPVIIPIPGTTTVERLKENMTDVELSENDIKELDSILAGITITGERYPGGLSHLEFADSPELREGDLEKEW